jgi:hypothetical protein
MRLGRLSARPGTAKLYVCELVSIRHVYNDALEIMSFPSQSLIEKVIDMHIDPDQNSGQGYTLGWGNLLCLVFLNPELRFQNADVCLLVQNRRVILCWKPLHHRIEVLGTVIQSVLEINRYPVLLQPCCIRMTGELGRTFTRNDLRVRYILVPSALAPFILGRGSDSFVFCLISEHCFDRTKNDEVSVLGWILEAEFDMDRIVANIWVRGLEHDGETDIGPWLNDSRA